jgi:hypothetical protein
MSISRYVARTAFQEKEVDERPALNDNYKNMSPIMKIGTAIP